MAEDGYGIQGKGCCGGGEGAACNASTGLLANTQESRPPGERDPGRFARPG